MYQPKKSTLLSSKLNIKKLSCTAQLIKLIEAILGNLYTFFQAHTHIETLHTHTPLLTFTYFNEEIAWNNHRLCYSVAQKNNSINNTISVLGKCRNSR